MRYFPDWSLRIITFLIPRRTTFWQVDRKHSRGVWWRNCSNTGVIMKYFLLLAIALFPIIGTCSLFERPQTAEDWEEQRVFLNENGYLWIRNFYDEEGITSLLDWAKTLHDQAQAQMIDEDFTGDLIIVPEASDSSLVCRTEDNVTCFPAFGDWVESTIQTFIDSLTGEPYALFKDKLNFKWPGGGAFTAHQDFPAYDPFPPRSHLNVMVCIDRATHKNGCLQVASNWSAIIEDPQEVLPFVHGGPYHGMIEVEFTENCEWLPLKTRPGDVVIFTSFIPHYSESNLSAESRRALFLTYNRLHEGDYNRAYYNAKRDDPQNPLFHIGTPTKARTKQMSLVSQRPALR